jgi:hypothetical protein
VACSRFEMCHGAILADENIVIRSGLVVWKSNYLNMYIYVPSLFLQL